MGKIRKLVKHRPVIDRRKVRDISREPEFIRLKEVFKEMSEGEQERTIRRLKGANK